MMQEFMKNNYKIVEFDEVADVYIVNTCTVTNIADKKSRQMLRKVKDMNPNSILIAVGCYAQVAKQELEKIPEIDLILGVNEKKDIFKYICLSFTSFLPLFYFCCIYYFGSLIFCCQNVTNYLL